MTNFKPISRLKPQKLKNSRGFTLIELLVALPITIAVMAVAFWLWWDFLRVSQDTVDYGVAVDAAESAVIQVIRDLRQAQASETGAYPLIQLDDQVMAFYADVDGDGVVERIDYALVDDRLERSVTEPEGEPPVYPLVPTQTRSLVSGVVNDGTALFLYYDSNWPGDTENNPLVPSQRYLDTRLVTVQIKVMPTEQANETVVFAQRSVTLRELKTNH